MSKFIEKSFPIGNGNWMLVIFLIQMDYWVPLIKERNLSPNDKIRGGMVGVAMGWGPSTI